MSQQAAAIVIAGVLIAVAVALTNHWSFSPGGYGGYLLNRWTGTVIVCAGPSANLTMFCPLDLSNTPPPAPQQPSR